MAKTKKVQFQENNHLRKKQNLNNKIMKKTNPNGKIIYLSCVLLENIDHLLCQYNISIGQDSATPLTKITVSQSAKTLGELVNDAWKRCKNHSKSQKNTLKEGQYVMAKMKSFSTWPAKITGFTKNLNKAIVYFFGTHNSGSVEVKEITLFQESTEVIRLQLLRHSEFFAKGIREVETDLGIPLELSVTNEQNLLK